MKVVILDGSISNGVTRDIINHLKRNLKSNFEKINIIDSNDYAPILFCKGEKNCFKQGYCLTDKIDDFSELKKELLLCDAVILATPIYAKHISGYFKNMLDRLSYMEHLMALSGKVGIIIAVAQNDTTDGIEYLNDFSTYVGLTTIDIISISLSKSKVYLPNIERAVGLLKMYAHNRVSITSSKRSEDIFRKYKKLYKINSKENYEEKRWREIHGESDSFQQSIYNNTHKWNL